MTLPEIVKPVQIQGNFHPGQQQVHDSTARFKVLSCGRRWGKTRLAVTECLQAAIRGEHVWWVAPATKHTKPGWEMFTKAGRGPLSKVCDVRVGDKELRFVNGGRIEIRTTHDPNQPLRGEGLDLVVMDECAFMRPDAWQAEIRPSLMDKQGSAIFISTPKGHNWFYDVFRKADARANWARWQMPTWTNPHIPESEYDDEQRIEYGSLLFAQEIEAEFLAAGGNVFKAEWFDSFYRMTTDEKGLRWVFLPDGTKMDYREATKFCTVDMAASLKESADYTVVMSFAVWKQWIVVLETVRKRVEGPDILPLVQSQIDKWDLGVAHLERAGFQLTLIQEARKRGMPVKELKADKDKLARALPATARMEAGNVVFPEEQPDWFDVLRMEAIVFPEADHDDQVDTLAYGVRVASRAKSKDFSGVWPDDLGRSSPNKI